MSHARKPKESVLFNSFHWFYVKMTDHLSKERRGGVHEDLRERPRHGRCEVRGDGEAAHDEGHARDDMHEVFHLFFFSMLHLISADRCVSAAENILNSSLPESASMD